MNQSDLETFIKVAQEESFSKAADKLHLTQPAISKRIANLEEELGSTLLDRIGKQVKMTHGGELLLKHAQQLLEAMRNCKNEIQNLNTLIEGTLKIGVSHHIGLHRFPPHLKYFSQTYPKVQLKIRFIDSEQAAPLILAGELEIALTTLNSQTIPHIEQQRIWRDPLTFVVNDNHALAKLNEDRLLTIEDLASFPAILPSNNTYTGKLIQHLFTQHNQSINHYIETNYLETIKMMVSIGMGWAVLPRTMLNKDLRGLQLNIDNLTRDLGYMVHKSRSPSNASKALINSLHNAI